MYYNNINVILMLFFKCKIIFRNYDILLICLYNNDIYRILITIRLTDINYLLIVLK